MNSSWTDKLRSVDVNEPIVCIVPVTSQFSRLPEPPAHGVQTSKGPPMSLRVFQVVFCLGVGLAEALAILISILCHGIAHSLSCWPATVLWVGEGIVEILDG